MDISKLRGSHSLGWETSGGWGGERKLFGRQVRIVMRIEVWYEGYKDGE